MAKKSNRCRQTQSSPQIQGNSAATPRTEPTMRRWPHPVVTASPEEDATLHYIYCALSYQNQLLADIKASLEHIVNESSTSRTTGTGSPASYCKK